MSRFCHSCGTKLPDDAVFCSGCGTRVKLPEQPAGIVNTNDIETTQPIVEPVAYSSPVEPPKAEEPVTYSSPVEPPKAEEPVAYSSPVEPPKAEEPVTYSSPVEPPKAEEPVTYSSPVEPPKPETGANVNLVQPTSYVGGTNNSGNTSYGRTASSVPAEQPIPGFGAPKGNSAKKEKKKKKKTGLVVFLVIVLLIAAGAATVFVLDKQGVIDILPKEEKSTYKEAIDLYVKGIEEQEIDTFLDAYGSFLVEEFADGEGEEYLEEVYEEYESEAGSDLKISYEVTKEKQYTESKLADLQEDLEDDYDFKGTIEEAYDITTEFTIKGDDGETDDRVKFLIVKIEGQWYLAEF